MSELSSPILRPGWAARRRFTAVTFLVSVLLLGWGAFVTSIDAGLAVPDWPTSFNSFDPFNPWPAWWTVTPILAEHGHRLLGALVGMLTAVLAVWTWKLDDRGWMRRLGWMALMLVIFQGVLGGLRVVWVSINLAIVHASVAQLFFATLAAMILFVSPAWDRARSRSTTRLPISVRKVTLRASAAVYFQIILGALLRHPGSGIDPVLAGIHFGWAFLASAAVFYAWITIRLSYPEARDLVRLSSWSLGILAVQVTLGLFAYFVLLDERGLIQPSNVQVVANTAHMVVGALLFAATVTTVVLSYRLSACSEPTPS